MADVTLSHDGACTAHRVWKVDCSECGTVLIYDEDAHPERCEECGCPVTEVPE